MTTNQIAKIRQYDQSIWMDYLNRSLIESGELEDLIKNLNIRGVTSNPAIFKASIIGNKSYDADIKAGIEKKQSVEDICANLIFDDIRKACDIFRPIYEESQKLDGYVSIEIPPSLARDTQKTISETQRFFKEINRPNVMIKIPGTPDGMAAIEQAISEGINVNITLLFSVDSYLAAAQAYIRGLEMRVQNNQPIDSIASVASFFISRIDVKVDELIDQRMKKIGTENLNEEARLSQIKGKVAIANAKIAYQKYKEIFGSERWKALEEKGANVQRLLWASTSTKNPEYSDVMYVDELIGKNTVNTLPLKTLEVCADHCHPSADQIETNVDHAYQLMESLQDPDIQIDLDQVMAELLEEGIDQFTQPYDELMQSLTDKAQQLTTV
ncbi:transaldolase [Limnoraphis robusta Tam1]|uniref:Transaldolase n=1 Tax=Limnoraphis robusta CCNP1315 TaxID=3110306 RepID=A0ABU5TZ43_9CYAN|nr:transaldolase [Limnoraphis robusta]MEA5520196.1 transaldolase [Limnoraphis robusta CCNP1315]MEA5542222.1 transaldolase [Limnoraphis robusta Tam1]MEA5546750.1 transaldolase [Limnoraphis robusta CCNP1324]